MLIRCVCCRVEPVEPAPDGPCAALLRLCLSEGDTFYSAKAEAEVLRTLVRHELAPCSVILISIKREALHTRTKVRAATCTRAL